MHVYSFTFLRTVKSACEYRLHASSEDSTSTSSSVSWYVLCDRFGVDGLAFTLLLHTCAVPFYIDGVVFDRKMFASALVTTSLCTGSFFFGFQMRWRSCVSLWVDFIACAKFTALWKVRLGSISRCCFICWSWMPHTSLSHNMSSYVSLQCHCQM